VLAFAHLLPYLNAAVIARATAGKLAGKKPEISGVGLPVSYGTNGSTAEKKERLLSAVKRANALRALDAMLFE
jgi:hypothetical protein